MKPLLIFAISFIVASAAAETSIPPDLIGIWAKEGSEFRGEALMKGGALYIDRDGLGMHVGGDGINVIGVRIAVTSFDPITNLLTIDLIENGKVRGSGVYTYDPTQRAIFWNKEERYYRRATTVSPAMRRMLAPETKTAVIAPERKMVLPQRNPTPVRNSNPPRIEGLAIKPGDSLENVRTATHNYSDRKFDGKSWYLEPFGDGTYVYFDASDRVEIIRLLSGAQTTIGGLPVRGSFSRMLARLGPPDVTETLPGGQTQAEIYYLNLDTAAIFYKSEPSGFIAETRLVSNKSHPPRKTWPDLSVDQ